MKILRGFRRVSMVSKSLLGRSQVGYYFSTTFTRAEFNRKLQQRQYYSILGFGDQSVIPKLQDIEVKRQYLKMVRRYHSDNITDKQQKIHYEQITKCIILAYQKISQQRMQEKIRSGRFKHNYEDENEVAMKMFGKSFDEIKYELFQDENAEKRRQFMEELQKVRQGSRYYEYVKSQQAARAGSFAEFMRKKGFGYQAAQSRAENFAQTVDDKVSRNVVFVVAVLGLGLGVLAYRSNASREEEREIRVKEREKLALGEEKVKEIERKSTERYEKRLNDLIDSFVEEMPPCLKYPSVGDPPQIDQLVEYTIGPDINLYEVSSKIMGVEQNLQKLKQVKTLKMAEQVFGKDFRPFGMGRVKVNSAISLNLQAERCLQNIYIKVSQVAQQIQLTGKYTPPVVFFRFYGYIMFQLREKPLSLLNYRNTQYISLFDLFFDFYSPIPIKRHEYNQYVVGITDEDMKMYGQVHLNHRKIPQKYITKQDKVVVMREQVSSAEQKYKQIWHNFYQKYANVWRRDYSDRIRNEGSCGE